MPSGLTKPGFAAKAPEGEEVSATAEFSADNDTEFRDNTATLGTAVQGDSAEKTDKATSSGGGSLGWLGLPGLAVCGVESNSITVNVKSRMRLHPALGHLY